MPDPAHVPIEPDPNAAAALARDIQIEYRQMAVAALGELREDLPAFLLRPENRPVAIPEAVAQLLRHPRDWVESLDDDALFRLRAEARRFWCGLPALHGSALLLWFQGPGDWVDMLFSNRLDLFLRSRMANKPEAGEELRQARLIALAVDRRWLVAGPQYPELHRVLSAAGAVRSGSEAFALLTRSTHPNGPLMRVHREDESESLEAFHRVDAQAAAAAFRRFLDDFISDPAVLKELKQATRKVRSSLVDSDDLCQEVCLALLGTGPEAYKKVAALASFRDDTDRQRYLELAVKNCLRQVWRREKRRLRLEISKEDPSIGGEDAADFHAAWEHWQTEKLAGVAQEWLAELRQRFELLRPELKPKERRLFDLLLSRDPSGSYLLRAVMSTQSLRLVPEDELVALTGWPQYGVSRTRGALRSRLQRWVRETFVRG